MKMIRQRPRKPSYQKEGALRLYHITNPPSEAEHYPVEDISHAKRLMTALAESDLMDDDVISNVFGLEVYEGREWIEWESADGDQIGDL